MARPIRIEYEQAVYHVMARGNERKEIYRGDHDKKLFLATLAEAVERYELKVYVYCLMRNHYHLIVETPLGNLSRAIGWLQTTYAIRFNRRHWRVGHLFQGRYKAQLVEGDAYAKQLITYIHLNPVRIGIKKGEQIPVERWEILNTYGWSSHGIYAGWEKAPKWYDASWQKYFGRKRWERQRKYRTSLRQAFEKGIDNPWMDLQQQLVLGGDELLELAKDFLTNKAQAEEQKWLSNHELEKRRQRVGAMLEGEPEWKVKIWLRVKVSQERPVDVGRELGYRDGDGIASVISRLEAKAQGDRKLKHKLDAYRRIFNL